MVLDGVHQRPAINTQDVLGKRHVATRQIPLFDKGACSPSPHEILSPARAGELLPLGHPVDVPRDSGPLDTSGGTMVKSRDGSPGRTTSIAQEIRPTDETTTGSAG